MKLISYVQSQLEYALKQRQPWEVSTSIAKTGFHPNIVIKWETLLSHLCL